jgi:uncharacterized protein (TIGR03089 family)
MAPMDLLAGWMARPGQAARPLITYYDVGSGERTELSGTTTANWVAKTANLLVDDCDGEPGTRVCLALPTHWLRCVWALATWTVGATLVDEAADVLVTGPDLDASRSPDAPHRLASALRPFGAPFIDPPDAFHDLGRILPGQPDAFFPLEPLDGGEVALELGGRRQSLSDLTESVAPSSERVLLEPDSLERDVDATVAALLGGGSLVFAVGASDTDLPRLADQEHAHLR